MNHEPHNQFHTAPPLHGTEQQPPKHHKPHADPDIAAKHRASKERYPFLALSRDEYVIEEVRRHPIILVSIWLFVGLLIFALFFALGLYEANRAYISSMVLVKGMLPSAAELSPLVLIFAAFLGLGGVIATIVYQGNRFYLTNESIFQQVQKSLFHTRTQVVNLINVEDASQDQVGIIPQLFNYGTLRLSTQGEETTYHFYFVANPRRLVGMVNDAAEKAVQRIEGVPATER